jgi:hypothetical protein
MRLRRIHGPHAQAELDVSVDGVERDGTSGDNFRLTLDDTTAISSWIAMYYRNQSRERECANDDKAAAIGVAAENAPRANGILSHLRIWARYIHRAASKNLFYPTPFLRKRRSGPPKDISS